MKKLQRKTVVIRVDTALSNRDLAAFVATTLAASFGGEHQCTIVGRPYVDRQEEPPAPKPKRSK